MQASRFNPLPVRLQKTNPPIFSGRTGCDIALDRNFGLAREHFSHRLCFSLKSGLGFQCAICRMYSAGAAVKEFPFLGLRKWRLLKKEQLAFWNKIFEEDTGEGGMGSQLLWTVSWRQATHSALLKPCQVTSEDSERLSGGESIILNEQTLERELQIAIKEENYAKAAKIRDSLRFLHEDSKASVLAANARFYDAFRNGNIAALQSLWSKDGNVCVVHPGVSGISGYDLVMGSWEFVWAEYEFPLEIEIKDVQAHVKGDVGYVTCIEMVKTKGSSWGRQFATNIFERIDGQWRMCVHHASYVDL